MLSRFPLKLPITLAFLLMRHQLAPVIERLVLPFIDDQYAEALSGRTLI